MYKLLASASVLYLALASPAFAKTTTTSTATTTSKACNPYKTSTVKFEKFPVNSGVPTNAGGTGFSWSGFTVVNLTALDDQLDDEGYGPGLNPASGTNAIVADQQVGPFISYNFQEGGEIFAATLQSFEFGCTVFNPAGTYPSGCTVQVTESIPISHETQIVTQSFEFAPNYSSPKALDMQKAVLDDNAWTIVYFGLTAGITSSVLYLDNVVLVTENPNCDD